MAKRRRNRTRQAVLAVVRFSESVCEGLSEVLGNEVQDEMSKRNIEHFRRGAYFVLRTLRSKR